MHNPHGRCRYVPLDCSAHDDDRERKRWTVIWGQRHREEARRRLRRPHDQSRVCVLVWTVRPRVELVEIVIEASEVRKVARAVRWRRWRWDGLEGITRPRISRATGPTTAIPSLIRLVAPKRPMINEAAIPPCLHQREGPSCTRSISRTRRPPCARIDAIVSIIVVAIRACVTTATECIRRNKLEPNAKQRLRLLRRCHVPRQRFDGRRRRRWRHTVANAAVAARGLYITAIARRPQLTEKQRDAVRLIEER